MKKTEIPFYLVIIAFLLFSVSFSSCRKPDGEENAKLAFSSGVIHFDTVFSTIGSATQRFSVYNPHRYRVTTDIFLASGNTSYFSMNVDGQPGIQFRDVVIEPQDSLLIFVKVNINPGNQNNPFLVTDSILFRTGSVEQDVDLVAYGQDAHFIVGDHNIGGGIRYKIVAGPHETVQWTNEKPYVVYGWAAVDSLGTLLIEEGTQIYFHHNSRLWIYRYGNLQVNGTAQNPVVFQGDRRGSWFESDYAQWLGIMIYESNRDNHIDHAIIKNAQTGIFIDRVSENLGNRNYIRNTVVKNTAGRGLEGWSANVELTSCQFSNNGGGGVFLAIGNFDIRHVTIADYYSGRTEPALKISNQYQRLEGDGGGGYGWVNYVGNANITAVNSIITGNIENEFVPDTNKQAGSLQWRFENSLLKTTVKAPSFFTECIFNTDPGFTDYTVQNFTLKANSPVIDKGKPGIGVPTDILGNLRSGNPDMGAYEYVGDGSKFVR